MTCSLFRLFRRSACYGLLLSLLPVAQALAATSGDGLVHMNGSITDAACNVATDSRDQTIDMLTQPVSGIIANGEGLPREFRIHLVNCVASRYAGPDWQAFRVTFDGLRDGRTFGVDGDAKGLALQIRDTNDQLAVPGEPMAAVPVVPGDMTLRYTLRLVGDGNVMEPGAYHSTLRYKLDYY